MIGQLIGGRYLVTGALGEGGMGVVYVGEQRLGSTVRKVAIKTLHPDLAADPALVARFHRECSTVASLEHPHTIRFYDFGATEDGTLYIAMEFIAGKPLSELIGQGPLPPARVVNIMRQLCGALDEAHARGIIHRDLKPDNVVLTQSSGEADFVKLLDFGIAARQVAPGEKQQRLTEPGTVLGTPEYMSPEQFSGRELDSRSDIYSLAVMSYEMVTGQLPFAAESPVEWAVHHLSSVPTPFEVTAPGTHVPPRMAAAILRALAKNRDERPSTVKEFLDELSVSEPRTRTVSMAAVAAPDSAERSPPRRYSGLVIAGIALPLVAAAVFVALPSRSHRQRDRARLVELSPSSSPGPTQIIPEPTAVSASSSESPPVRARPSPAPSVSASAAPSSSPPGARACEACVAAAEAGNVAEVALNLALCSDAKGKAECLAASRKRARAAASSLPALPKP